MTIPLDTKGRPLEFRYANYFEIGFNDNEIVFDFGQHYQNEQQPQVHSRIVMTPAHAEALSKLLEETLSLHTSARNRDTSAT
jgi:hypothetical protein